MPFPHPSYHISPSSDPWSSLAKHSKPSPCLVPSRGTCVGRRLTGTGAFEGHVILGAEQGSQPAHVCSSAFRREGASAHLQRHKQAGDGDAHTAPTDPTSWTLMSLGCPPLGKGGDFDSMCPVWAGVWGALGCRVWGVGGRDGAKVWVSLGSQWCVDGGISISSEQEREIIWSSPVS